MCTTSERFHLLEEFNDMTAHMRLKPGKVKLHDGTQSAITFRREWFQPLAWVLDQCQWSHTCGQDDQLKEQRKNTISFTELACMTDVLTGGAVGPPKATFAEKSALIKYGITQLMKKAKVVTPTGETQPAEKFIQVLAKVQSAGPTGFATLAGLSRRPVLTPFTGLRAAMGALLCYANAEETKLGTTLPRYGWVKPLWKADDIDAILIDLVEKRLAKPGPDVLIPDLAPRNVRILPTAPSELQSKTQQDTPQQLQQQPQQEKDCKLDSPLSPPAECSGQLADLGGTRLCKRIGLSSSPGCPGATEGFATNQDPSRARGTSDQEEQKQDATQQQQQQEVQQQCKPGGRKEAARSGPCIFGCLFTSQVKAGRPVWKATPSPSPWASVAPGTTLCKKCYDRAMRAVRRGDVDTASQHSATTGPAREAHPGTGQRDSQKEDPPAAHSGGNSERHQLSADRPVKKPRTVVQNQDPEREDGSVSQVSEFTKFTGESNLREGVSIDQVPPPALVAPPSPDSAGQCAGLSLAPVSPAFTSVARASGQPRVPLGSAGRAASHAVDGQLTPEEGSSRVFHDKSLNSYPACMTLSEIRQVPEKGARRDACHQLGQREITCSSFLMHPDAERLGETDHPSQSSDVNFSKSSKRKISKVGEHSSQQTAEVSTPIAAVQGIDNQGTQRPRVDDSVNSSNKSENCDSTYKLGVTFATQDVDESKKARKCPISANPSFLTTVNTSVGCAYTANHTSGAAGVGSGVVTPHPFACPMANRTRGKRREDVSPASARPPGQGTDGQPAVR